MRRFFVEEISGDTAFASESESAHIVKVLRLKKGDEAIIFDGNGNCLRAVLTDDNPQRAVFKIIETIEESTESPLDIIVCQAVIKNDKFDYVVQKCVELGVSQIQPFISRYCVKKPKNPQAFIERANRLALEAAKQCGRHIIPEVLPIIEIGEMPNTLPEDCPCFLLYEREKSATLKEILQKYKKNGKDLKNAAIIVGPEGGFDEKEVSLLIKCGAVSVSLGKRILRAETAAPAAAAMFLYEFEL